jgi:formate dehydrogenase beta subunit
MSQLLRSIRKLNPEYVDKPVKHIYRIKAQELDPEVRKQIFEEVEKPISMEEAYQEANRCMRCYRVYSVMTEK